MLPAELILNPDGSIYHLHLLPADVANTIILVGDQDRVPLVSKYFDNIEVKKQRREFITHTGWLGQKRISVISTGIGTDNIDIVLNELDAVHNIDLENRSVKASPASVQIIRIGTSGSIHPDVPIDSIVISGKAIGLDALGFYYDTISAGHELLPDWAYITSRGSFDLKDFPAPFTEGITLTLPGFYAPQGRKLRLESSNVILLDELHKHSIEGLSFTNLEMETAGMYLLAEKLGHRAISFNAILANRLQGNFSAAPEKIIDRTISAVLDWITRNP